MNSFEINGAISALARAGFETPENVTAMRGAEHAAKAAITPEVIAQRLREAIESGDEDAAIRAVLDSSLDARGRADLIEWATSGALVGGFPWAAAYRHAAKLYDGEVEEFTNACRAVDPDAAPDVVVQLRNPARQYWADMPAMAAKVEQAATLLRQVAAFAIPGFEPLDASHQVGLLADAGKCSDPMALELAMKPKFQGGRGGRWAAMLKMGCSLRAADIETYEPMEALTVR